MKRIQDTLRGIIRSILFLVVSLNAAAQADPAEDSKKPWLVEGIVVTDTGAPLAGVDVVAHTGVGSLRAGGRTATRADGAFELRFGPGFWFKDGEGVQAATISTRKEGWFETNLYRQGDLLAAFKLPKGEIGWGKKTANDIFLPGKPKRLKFTMAPAAKISGVLLDENGAPLANQRVGLTGDQLPPSSSVFVEVRSDGKGAFEFKDLPTTFELKLYVESENSNRRNRPSLVIKLPEPREFRIRIKRTEERLELSGEPAIRILRQKEERADPK